MQDMDSEVTPLVSTVRSRDEMSPGGQEVQWHNHWGTSADHQGPAESTFSGSWEGTGGWTGGSLGGDLW